MPLERGKGREKGGKRCKGKREEASCLHLTFSVVTSPVITFPHVMIMKNDHRQPGRASAVVVLKHETLARRQRHNFISIDFKFGVGDYVREVTNLDKVGSGPMSGRDATWGQHIRELWLFLYSSTEIQPTNQVNQFLRTIAQKTRSGVRKTLLWWEMYNSEFWGCFTLKTHL